MNRKHVDNDIYKIYTEGVLRNLATGAAMGAASLMGSPTTAMGDTTYSSEYNSETQRVIQVEEFISLWGQYYQTQNKKEKLQNARELLSDGVDIPSNAKHAIDVAVNIFGGDMGVSPNVLEDLLIYTGEVESNYKTRVQYNGGPARSYWQVEPKTVIDQMINGRQLFGEKFKKRFGKKAEWLLNINEDTPRVRATIAKLLEKDDELGASLAAVKWIRSAHKELRN